MTPKDGFIYILQEESTSLFKIGFTQDDNVKTRISNIQVGNPHSIQFIGSFYTYSIDVEKTLHTYFAKYHVRGEWFKLTQEHVDNILSSTWRETHNIFADNLELTIDALFQEYYDINDKMTKLLRNLRHILSTYKLQSTTS